MNNFKNCFDTIISSIFWSYSPSIGGGGGGFGGVDTIVNANHIGISNKDNVGEMTSSLNVDRIVKKLEIP